MYGYNAFLVSDTRWLVCRMFQESVSTRLRLLLWLRSKFVIASRLHVNRGSKQKWHWLELRSTSANSDFVAMSYSLNMSLGPGWAARPVVGTFGILITHFDLSGLRAPANTSFTNSTLCFPKIPMNLLLLISNKPN